MSTLASTRQTTILRALAQGPCSAWALASLCNCPEASIRRELQVLRRQGHRISYGFTGVYWLYQPAPQEVAREQIDILANAR